MDRKILISLLGIMLLWLPQALGEQLTNLFHTGVDNSGALISNTLVDPHYSLIVSPDISYPGPAAYVVEPAPPWVVNGPISKWLSPAPDGGSSFRAFGDYKYRTQFDLTGYDPCTCVVTGVWASDDETYDILINGLSTGNSLSSPSTFDYLHPLAITNGFISGTNTIDFIVHNGGFQTGMRAELFGFASVGEGAHLRITAIERVNTNILVSFTTCSNRTYGVDYALEILLPLFGGPPLPIDWHALTNGIAGTGSIVTFTDVGAAALPRKFYRVRVTLP